MGLCLNVVNIKIMSSMRDQIYSHEGGTKLLSETLREKGNSVPLFT